MRHSTNLALSLGIECRDWIEEMRDHSRQFYDIALEDGLAPITTVHHMIDRARIFDSEFARHEPQNRTPP